MPEKYFDLSEQDPKRMVSALSDINEWHRTGQLPNGVFRVMADESGADGDYRKFESDLLLHLAGRWAKQHCESDLWTESEDALPHAFVIGSTGPMKLGPSDPKS